MIKDIVAKEVKEQIKLIENTINSKFAYYLNTITSFINNLFSQFIGKKSQSTPKINKKTKKNCSSHLEILKTLDEEVSLYSMCFLKDGRLVSSGDYKIMIYNRDSYEPDIIIQDNSHVYSVCGLKNGNLASGGFRMDGTFEIYNINIREINGNEYKSIHKLEGYFSRIYKIIELEDGKLCTCSYAQIIKIWDNKKDYKCLQKLEEHGASIRSIIEIDSYIISVAEKGMKKWNKQTYELIQTLDDVSCISNNGLSKLKNNTLVLGGNNEIFIVDLSFKCRSFKSKDLGEITSISVLKENVILIGNNKGRIIFFEPTYYQIFSIQKLYSYNIFCIILSDDNKIFSSSKNKIFMLTANFG